MNRRILFNRQYHVIDRQRPLHIMSCDLTLYAPLKSFVLSGVCSKFDYSITDDFDECFQSVFLIFFNDTAENYFAISGVSRILIRHYPQFISSDI